MAKDIKIRLRCSEDLSTEDFEKLLWGMISESKGKIIFVDKLINKDAICVEGEGQ